MQASGGWSTYLNPTTAAVRGYGNYGGGLALLDGSYGIVLYSTGGTLNFGLGSNTSVSQKASLDTNGNFTANGNVTAYSDKRLKTNVTTIVDALNKVTKIRGVTFNRIDIESDDLQMGVIAQEVKQIVPEVVMGSEDTTYSVAYGNMVGLLIEAIKEQQVQIETQNKEIDQLKSMLNTLIDFRRN